MGSQVNGTEEWEDTKDEVTRLHLTYKQLTDFPTDLLTDQNCNVNVLYLGRNLITKLPEDFKHLISLVELHINNNKLKDLPTAIGTLVNLEILGVAGNQLSGLPDSIGDLQRLQRLNLSNNNIRNLPTSIGQLSELTNLDVPNNLLFTLPGEISSCKNLVRLNLDNNRLVTLPRQLKCLDNLIELSASGNNLYVFPQDIGKKTSFENLYIDRNVRLNALPISVKDKQLGFVSCGTEALELELLEKVSYVNIQHTPKNKLPIILPPEIQNMCTVKNCVPTLLELALRKTSNSLQYKDADLGLPQDLQSLITCSTGSCLVCNQEIYVSGFPVVTKYSNLQINQYSHLPMYMLGLCCSLMCTRHAYFAGFPLVYPTSEDFMMAVMII